MMAKQKLVNRAKSHKSDDNVGQTTVMNLEQLVEAMEAEYPGKVIYEFTLNCASPQDCKKIQRYMASQNFEVHIKTDEFGDHFGLKKFKTPKQAEQALQAIIRKFNTDKQAPKIKKAYVYPELLR